MHNEDAEQQEEKGERYRVVKPADLTLMNLEEIFQKCIQVGNRKKKLIIKINFAIKKQIKIFLHS